MDCVKTRGIVAKRADYSESNCMLTIFTENLGTVSACVYGVKSNKSRLRAAAQPLCFAEFVLYKKQGDIYRVESADIIESFYPVTDDIQKFALASYLFDLMYDGFSGDDASPLTLLLNTIYALSYKNVAAPVAKAVFELKLMQFLGYEPNTCECAVCGRGDELTAFNFDGGFVCEFCKRAEDVKISADVKSAVRYIMSCDVKHLFSFAVSDKVCFELGELAEKYILNKSEKRYKSLEYYKKVSL